MNNAKQNNGAGNMNKTVFIIPQLIDNLTVKACRQFEVDGYAYPYHPETKTAVSMTDEDGNNAVWFACGAKDYRTGETFKVKATVKRHGTDRDGNKQTVLTRCTFPKGSEAEAE